MPGNTPILAGVDTGGTFTDVVVLSGGRLRHCKVLSTPDDPSRAIHEGLDRLGVTTRVRQIIHGTTVGTNAVLEGKGAKVVYVTSRGFADVLSLGRQQREEVYRLQQAPLRPPVPPNACIEVSTRITATGDLLEEASDRELDGLVEQIAALEPEAVAINLLFSFLRPEQEQRIAERLGERWFVSLSSKILPELREFERGIATWLNASVGPIIGRYLAKLQERIPQAGISVMQSSGTTISAQQAAGQAARLLLSGPAGGLAAAALAGRVTGKNRLLTFDMGGTSTDVALLDGEIPLSRSSQIGTWPLALESVDIHTIGAGGGSIARVDAGGLLLVGPESAGASPGPACYDRGGEEATVTDANIVLGRIPHDTLLGGYLPLNKERAVQVIDRLAAQLCCDRHAAARGVVRLANEHMARALRVISVERGHDPREYALFSFGGAGGLHACDLADLLDMNAIVLPARAGVLSAQGMLASEPGRDLSRAVLRRMAEVDEAALVQGFEALRSEAERQLLEEGIDAADIRCTQRLELRYLGQNAALVLEFQPGKNHVEGFHCAHEAANGHRLDQAVELVNLRLSARAPAPVTEMEPHPVSGESREPATVYMTELKRVVTLLERATLPVGYEVYGPAILTDKVGTAWVAPGWRGQVDAWGNLCLERVPNRG